MTLFGAAVSEKGSCECQAYMEGRLGQYRWTAPFRHLRQLAASQFHIKFHEDVNARGTYLLN